MNAHGIEKLLTLKPRKCQAQRCRRDATAQVTLTHPRWKGPQHADLCEKHLDTFVAKAIERGIEVTRII